MGVAVAVPERRPGLWVRDLNLKFKGNGKILMFKQNVFSKVGPKKSQVTCFKSEQSGSKGVPGSGSQSICTERRGAGQPVGRVSSWELSTEPRVGKPGSEIHRGSAPDILQASVCEQEPLPFSKSIPLVHCDSFCGGGHHSPLCTSLPGGQHCPHPPSVQGGFQGDGVAGTAWSWHCL